MSASTLAEMIAGSFRELHEGSIVKGRILEIKPQVVLVDIGYKSEGAIPASEFEDEDIQARNLSMLLEDSGYDVVGVVPTAEDALAVYQNCVPEFAVIDFNLGSAIDGLTLARHLSERYSTRVVIVT